VFLTGDVLQGWSASLSWTATRLARVSVNKTVFFPVKTPQPCLRLHSTPSECSLTPSGCTNFQGHHAPAKIAASATSSVLLDPYHSHQALPGAYQRRPYVFPQSTASLMEEDEYPSGVQTPHNYVSNLGEPFSSWGLQSTSVIESRADDAAEPPGAVAGQYLMSGLRWVFMGTLVRISSLFRYSMRTFVWSRLEWGTGVNRA